MAACWAFLSTKLRYRRGTTEVTTIFFLHSGNTDITEFCTYAQDSYTSSQKVSREFNEFYTCLVCVMMNWKETATFQFLRANCCSIFNNRKLF